ncbi:hypothetical protein CALVIDRAFT_505443 [Calocera viscosa TUFC12733]|uniref:XPG-I domain-containing protein n=1 Tax=Calocera viscosa (strain TUFC12733) TaxID=1330018 RepID=A0A167HHR9_CALVF|nr:hypothetical protein CALVIDRAFT_505443 [Calocera viscosa TUFC12733]
MGIPGLWDIIRPAGKSRSLTHLTVVDGFEDNPSGKRAYRVGIDASIWFFHANGGQGGENPELRTLYFRCCRLLALPVLPLFVFDGPLRPSQKRGKRIGKSEHWMVSGMREIIDAFGFEWWTAPGEAEAELAYLNDIGVIDAILSDDVDNFLFGAKVVIRNPSATLTGTQTHVRKTGQGDKDDGQHVIIYRANDIESHPDIGLKRGDLILIGLLSGGDYNTSGLMGIGINIAYALAKCGYGDKLLNDLEQLKDRNSRVSTALEEWRTDVRRELSGPSEVTTLLKKKYPAKAKAIPDDFPAIKDVCAYAAPITSFTENRDVSVIQWRKKPNLGKIAGICERHFEWGIKEIIIKRFRTTVWQGAVLRALMEAVLRQEERLAEMTPLATPRKATARQIPNTPGTRLADAFLSLDVTSPTRPAHSREPTTQEASSSNPSAPSQTIADINLSSLVLRIHSSRTHPSTDNMLEYRLEVDPAQLIAHTEAGIQGTRLPPDAVLDGEFSDPGSEDDDGQKKTKKKKTAPPDPLSTLRIWMPAAIVRLACPALVEEVEAVQQEKAAKKAKKPAPKKRAATAPERTTLITQWARASEEEADIVFLPSPPKRPASASTQSSADSEEQPRPNRLLFPVSKPGVKQSAKARSTTDPGRAHDPFFAPLCPGSGAQPCASTSRPHADPFAYLSGPVKPNPSSTKQSSKPAVQKRPVSLAPSDSDDRSRQPNIPRKTKEHRSPRKGLHSDTEDEMPQRADSPLRPLSRPFPNVELLSGGAVIKGGREVIVISSDDETPRAGRLAPGRKPVKKVAVVPTRAASLSSSDVEVIDLT